jgi:hypothetical protein
MTNMRVYKFLDAHFGLKSLREKRLKISTLDDLNDPFELLPYEMTDRAKRDAFRGFQQDWAVKFGIICFSADWKDPVIWAHYSDKHRGLCLGFEILDEAGQPVRYIDTRLPLPEAFELAHANALLFTKYRNWAYEKEIRFYAKLDTILDGLYFMDFGNSMKLVEVIAGARCRLTKNEVLDALRPLEDVKLIKARAGFHRFEIVEDQRGLK